MKAVIFDLDGVLVSTDELHYQAWLQIARSEGISFDRTLNDRLRGVSRMQSLEIILERAGHGYAQKEKEALARQKNGIYRTLLGMLTPDALLPGARETLCTLRKRGIKTAIGSSSKNAPLILQQLQIETLFDAVSDGNGLQHSKPHPEVFLRAAEYLGEQPQDCLVVEDAEAGIQAAKAAGMQAAALGSARTCPKADYRLDRLMDLLTFFPMCNNKETSATGWLG